MKHRTLIVIILGVLLASSMSQAQDTGAPEPQLQEPVFTQSDSPSLPQPEPSPERITAQAPPEAPKPSRRYIELATERPASRLPSRTPSSARPKIPTQMRIFRLRHIDAVDMASMIENVFMIQVYADERLHNIIVNARPEQMESIESLIEASDVPDPEASTPQDVQNLVYRVYMFEIASGDQNMKPFSMILQVPPEASTMQLLDVTKATELQISGFCLSDEHDRDGKAEILIQGKAASYNSLKRIVYDAIPESRIKELKWDNAETFTNEIEAAQFWQLPGQMQKHIAKLLGDDILPVGYWFGNSSVPGEVQAPIGPWTLNMQLNTESDNMLELGVEVKLPREIHNFDTRLGHQQNDEILSNTIRAKIGKPIIIGYNRESYGTRKMGAMVILPEADTISIE
ncbi:MAG: hypothetical protein GY845_33845 [Planctomycetes bacterium]|nr:hypothetical protein [Planctomycetota bacterium]